MIRRLFESRPLRERALLTGFVWIVLLFWALMLMRGYRDGIFEMRSAKGALADQRFYLERADDIGTRLTQARDAIDTDKALNGLQLAGAVQNIASDAELLADIGSAVRSESGIFNTYRVRVSARRATMEQLLAFTQEVRKRAPYIALRSFEVSSNRRDPRQLDAVMQIESFELTETHFE